MPDHLFPLVTTDSFVITPPTRGGCCLEHAKTPKQQFNTICMTKHWLGYPLLHGSSQLRGQGGTISKMNRTPPPSCHPHRTMVTDDLFTVSESLPGLGPMTPVMVMVMPIYFSTKYSAPAIWAREGVFPRICWRPVSGEGNNVARCWRTLFSTAACHQHTTDMMILVVCGNAPLIY